MRPVGMLLAVLALAVASPGGAADYYDITSTLPSTYVIARSDGAASRSGTGGVQYTLQPTGGSAPLRGVAWLSGLFVAVGDGGRVVRSSDGGLSWSPEDAGTSANLYAITTHAPNYLIAVGAGGTTLRRVGTAATWDTTASPGNATLRAVASNGSIVVAVGDGGTALRSTDQGLSWQRQVIAGAPALRGVEGTSNVFVAVGLGGRIFRSTDSGLTWDAITSPTTADLFAVETDHTSRLVAVGAAGTVLRSGTNGASESWFQMNFPVTVALRGVHFDGSSFFAVGDMEVTARSSDGTSWFQVGIEPTTWGRVKALYGGAGAR
jgi:photosystem II stability/assembly factor-like uncharacterized protein